MLAMKHVFRSCGLILLLVLSSWELNAFNVECCYTAQEIIPVELVIFPHNDHVTLTVTKTVTDVCISVLHKWPLCCGNSRDILL